MGILNPEPGGGQPPSRHEEGGSHRGPLKYKRIRENFWVESAERFWKKVSNRPKMAFLRFFWFSLKILAENPPTQLDFAGTSFPGTRREVQPAPISRFPAGLSPHGTSRKPLAPAPLTFKRGAGDTQRAAHPWAEPPDRCLLSRTVPLASPTHLGR